MQLLPFRNIDLSDPFFDSLKSDYQEFETWFNKKSLTEAKAYVNIIDNEVQAFLYLKLENDEIENVSPVLGKRKWLKIGTFKVNAHGTRLGNDSSKRFSTTPSMQKLKPYT